MSDTSPYLETHRFRIHENSLGLMKGLRTSLNELNQEFKIIKGLSYFGSRTKGLEYDYDPHMPDVLGSDIDICVFYDGAVFGDNPQKEEELLAASLVFDHTTGNLSIDPRKAQHQRELTRARRQFEVDLQGKFKERITTHMDEKILQEGNSIFIVDISQAATRRSLNEFYESVRLNDDKFSFTDENLKLLSRFFLGVGDGLYENRRFILEELEKRPDGDRLFPILMQRLGEFERTRDTLEKKVKEPVLFTKYPKSIEEARHFFLTK